MTAPNPDGFFPDLRDENACSVSVAVRVRPFVGRELAGGKQKECVFPAEHDVESQKLQMAGKSFNFDSVFFAQSSQEAIFDKCTRNLVLGTFHGYNATILAYGQTGSGKTHTMGTGCTIGMPFDQVGIVPRVFKFIFDEVDMRKAQSEYSSFRISISFLEIYNEEIHDLLDPASMVRDKITGKPGKEVSIREEKNGNISVRGLKDQEVSKEDECSHWLNLGINHRQTSATLMNEGSSRSHAIFTITIEQKIVKEVETPEGEEKKEDGPATVTEEISAKFHFVDLAGSERIKKTGASGKLMKEGISINKGLLNLGLVISALTKESGGSSHIPYRDSKVTRILQDSLGGNSRTTMIACVSPAESNYEETMGTIKYASRARNIKNKPIVNRDPNSMLIESLRGQISTLQFEVKEYVTVIQTNGLEMPSNVAERAFERQKTMDQKRRQSMTIERPAIAAGGADPGEIKTLKIKLSHKEKEIRELQQKLKDQSVFNEKKDKSVQDAENERDAFAMQVDNLKAKLKENNIEFDGKPPNEKGSKIPGGGVSSALVDQYKAKLQKSQREVDSKIREMQEKDSQIAMLKQQAERNDKMVKKHMQENAQLKKQGNSSSFEPRGGDSGNSENISRKPKRDFKTQRAERKQNAQKTIEEFNDKFITDLQGQIDEMFSNVSNRREKKLEASQQAIDNEEDTTRDQTLEESMNKTVTDEDGKPIDAEAAEKEKILAAVRKQAINMSSDIKDLLKNEWAGSINTLETEKNKAEKEKKENLLRAKDDSKKVAAIEKEHSLKMDSLNREMSKLEAEKKKKEESVAKQIAMQEARIKALEADVNKQKLKREEIEKAKKYDENRFFNFKQNVSKDLASEKKKQSDKEKEMGKLKNDLKKVDQLAQTKIAQLRGLQKRAKEERETRSAQEEKELESKGIDIDLIKDWISRNTEAMLKNQELKEYLEKQIEQKDKVEQEMLEEGDRMTELLIQKEKLEMEREDLEDAEGDSKDEGRLLEIDDQLKDIALEINSITETLDMLEETLEFVQSKVNQVTEEIESFDLDSVQPLSFNALDSIESAKATLRTFFQVVLDLNIYKRDIENKCIEQDEHIIHLTASVNTAEARVKYMIEHGGSDGYAASVAKQQAISTMLQQVDGFVDNRDVEHLNLNKTEQANLTKLSLSKIVGNLQNKLKEQETKNQQISLKLDSALKEKGIYKQRFDELKREQKNLQFGQPSRPAPVFQRPTPAAANAGGRPKAMAFKDRQKLKQQQQPQAPSKSVESLAERRKAKKPVIEQEESQALESRLDRLKNTSNLLEEIQEEELPEVEFEDEALQQPGAKDGASLLEPDQNISQLMGNDISKISVDQGEDWTQETLLNLSIEMNARLVDYYFINGKMVCVYENFQVQEIDTQMKEVSKSFNLQEVEGFEISEDVEEDKVVAFALEKDVMLVSIACRTSVHVFEFLEEDEPCLGHIACVQRENITSLLFVNYHLLMVEDQKDKEDVQIACWDPDSGSVLGNTELKKDTPASKILLQSGSECIYFAAGTFLGKIELPTMSMLYKVESAHRGPIVDMVVTSLHQIVTASEDGDIRFFNVFNGQKAGQPLQEMECDHLATQGIHLLTRIGSGAALLVWKLMPTGGVEEIPVGEVELDTSNSEKTVAFNMKGGVTVNPEGGDSEELIMMHLLPDQVRFDKLTRS